MRSPAASRTRGRRWPTNDGHVDQRHLSYSMTTTNDGEKEVLAMDITGDEGALTGALDRPVSAVLRTERGVFQVSHDMDVRGVDGVRVGHLTAVHTAETAILVHRPLLQRDLYVPFNAIKEVHDGAIVLTIPADQVDHMGWPHPPLLDLPLP